MKYIKRLNINFNDWDEIKDNNFTEFEGHEDFYNFLKNNNILNKYIKYFYDKKYTINVSRIKKDIVTIKDFLNYYSEKFYFYNAFTWKRTKEHYYYWFDISNRWDKKIKN